MNELGITALWEGLSEAGMPEVMLYLTDGGAYRCHWDDTVMLGATRVALLGDQDRGIVRIVPVESCIGIGIPSPKGVDPVGYRSVVREKVMGAGAPGDRWEKADDAWENAGGAPPWDDLEYLRAPRT